MIPTLTIHQGASDMGKHRGFFGIGIYHPKHEVNVGTLWRSAQAFGASMLFTVGCRYRGQASDTGRAYKSIPFFHFADVQDLIGHLPHSCPLIGVELHETARPLDRYVHNQTACYMLGAEDYGIPPSVLECCHQRLVIPHASRCLNVAVAGSIVLYDRMNKAAARLRELEAMPA